MVEVGTPYVPGLKNSANLPQAMCPRAQLERRGNRASNAENTNPLTSLPILENIVRTGPDYSLGRSVVEEDFIRTFGFSGIEYGNWTNQKERQQYLQYAYDSFMDLARVMGAPPKRIVVWWGAWSRLWESR